MQKDSEGSGEEDKIRKKAGRKAAEKEQDSSFLNKEALEDDLIEPDEEADDAIQVTSSDRSRQEWGAREDVNKSE